MEKGVPIRSLSRGIAILQEINRGGSLSMMEIARTSQVPYPTACRIVQTLVHEGLIEREPSRKRYRPTALVQTLAHGFQGHAALVQAARPHIVDLTRRVGWPITLSTHVGHSMVIRDSTHSLTALTFNTYYPGYAMPILECAAGLAYLAHLPHDERMGILGPMKLVGINDSHSYHIIQLLENETMVGDILREGYASRGNNLFTRNPGKTSSIAVPVHDKGTVTGALTLAYFSIATRMQDAVAKFVGPLQDCASAITHDLAQ